MTTVAIGRRAGEIIAQGITVAGVTVGRGVDSRQRKSERRVLLEQRLAIFPAFRSVTPLTLNSQFAAMHVAMTIRTLGRSLGEAQVLVTRNAGRLLVCPDQRELSALVIEASVLLDFRP